MELDPDKIIPKLENSYFPSKFHVEFEFHMPNVPSVEGFEIISHFRVVHSQSPYNGKIHVLELNQIPMKMHPLDRASKSDQENGMVYYSSTKTS